MDSKKEGNHLRQILKKLRDATPVAPAPPQRRTLPGRASITPVGYQAVDEFVDRSHLLPGGLTLKAAGVATISVSYLGFSAQSTVTASPLPAPPAVSAPPADVPAITQQPNSSSVYIGDSASLTVSAAGASPLSYQWQFNGTDIAGATSPALTLSNLNTAQGGNSLR